MSRAASAASVADAVSAADDVDGLVEERETAFRIDAAFVDAGTFVGVGSDEADVDVGNGGGLMVDQEEEVVGVVVGTCVRVR